MSFYDYDATRIDGSEVSLSQYQGKVVLVVNTASACGFTPQYTGLEELHKKYADKGVAILGFPCNQFANQEKGSNSEIAQFCQINFGVTFPLFQKIEVNGPHAHPLYQYLKKEKRGVFGLQRIPWNFTKFLIDAQGYVVARFAPVVPLEVVEKKIQSLLKL